MTLSRLHNKEIIFFSAFDQTVAASFCMLYNSFFSNHSIVGCYIIWVVDSIVICMRDNCSILSGSVWNVFTYKTWGSYGICWFAGCACHSLVDGYWHFRGDGDEGGRSRFLWNTGNNWSDCMMWYLKRQRSSVQKHFFFDRIYSQL